MQAKEDVKFSEGKENLSRRATNDRRMTVEELIRNKYESYGVPRAGWLVVKVEANIFLGRDGMPLLQSGVPCRVFLHVAIAAGELQQQGIDKCFVNSDFVARKHKSALKTLLRRRSIAFWAKFVFKHCLTDLLRLIAMVSVQKRRLCRGELWF